MVNTQWYADESRYSLGWKHGQADCRKNKFFLDDSVRNTDPYYASGYRDGWSRKASMRLAWANVQQPTEAKIGQE